jgi:hypothetical protein
VKGYRLIDLSSDWLIIERSVQFDEGVSHVPQQPHENTFTLPPAQDDDHEHVEYYLDEVFDSEESEDSDSELESVQSHVESEHPDAVAEQEQRPKWEQTNL